MKILKILILLSLTACTTSKKKQGEILYTTHCASCHSAPSPKDLPKHLWKESVLPEMGARMGIKDSTYSPFSGFTYREQEAMMRTGIYHVLPSISKEEWELLKDYILEAAPAQIEKMPLANLNSPLTQFSSESINLDSINGSYSTFLEIEPEKGTVITADIRGKISEYDYRKKKIVYQDNFESAITSYIRTNSIDLITIVGNLNPSEIPNGKIYGINDNKIFEVAEGLHRPVHSLSYDFDKNGSEELVVSEFGNLTGALSLWSKGIDSTYQKKILLRQPGVIRTVIKDMNGDNQEDIILLTTQGDEGITILYHTEELNFKAEQVLRFSPLYGSSWFDLIDYNSDGYDDIIVVQGDNADKTFVNKPYHGMRIYINNGQNKFDEKFFFPLYGATRFVANDFDEDGDIDIGIVASFPDYEKHSGHSFVYLENIDSKNFEFKPFGLENSSLGRWLLMDSGDIDNDGDQDIVLSSFTYYLTPVPEDLFKSWSTSNVDLMILENKLR